MTWLGKILTFVVMVASVVWMYLTAQAFVTRTNWQARASSLETALKETRSARETEFQRFQASEAALKGLLETEQNRNKDLSTSNKSISDAAAKSDADFKRQQDALFKGDVDATKLQTNFAGTVAELDTVRKRNTDLENDRVALVLAAEEAKREEVKALNSARLALAIADDNARKVEELQGRVTDLLATGGTASGTVLRSINKPPPPVLANLRGEVTRVAGDLLTISVGIDAGIGVGTVLDIYRTEGGQGKYLGKVKVTSGLNLFPKESIVTFIPARPDIPLDRLPAGDLPRRGDLVRPAEALTGNR